MEDPTDVGAFLRALRGPDEPHHLVTIDPDGKGPGKVTGRKHAADHDDRIAKFIARQNGERHRNAFFTLNRVKGNPKHGKAKKSDISAVLGYGIDIDPPATGADLSAWREKKASKLRESGQPPTAIWCSGNGIQAAWMLGEPIPVCGEDDWQPHEAINAALARMFGGDATQNIDRLFRLPGTMNYPDVKKRANGRKATPSYVIEGPNDLRYAPEDFADLVADADVATAAASPTASAAAITGDPNELMAALPESLQALIRSSPSEGHRSDQVCKVVRSAFEHGLLPDQIEAVLAAHPDGVAEKFVRRGDLRREIQRLRRKWDRSVRGNRMSLNDFYAFMPMHNHIYAPTRDMWSASSVDARIPLVETGKINPSTGEPTKIKASLWLDQNRPVEQITWMPGEPEVIRDKIMADGGWIDEPGRNVFNLYRPPNITPGNPTKAGPWLDHIHYIYPDDAEHIIKWLAHRVQRPGLRNGAKIGARPSCVPSTAGKRHGANSSPIN